MRNVAGAKCNVNDRLVVEYEFPDGKIVRQGKRVKKDCPLTAEERQVYAQHGTTRVLKALRHNRQISLSEAANLLNSARRYQSC